MARGAEHRPDVYYRGAKASALRARSAFKLAQLDRRFALLDAAAAAAAPPPFAVLDLCAAPGSWAQYVASRLPPSASAAAPAIVLAIDLQRVRRIPRVVPLQLDLTRRDAPRCVAAALRSLCSPPCVPLALCDGAADVAGLRALDAFAHAPLLAAVLRVARRTLRHGGTLVVKLFVTTHAPHRALVLAQLRLLFERVQLVKPRASRVASAETFAVCRGFNARCPPDAPARFDAFVRCGDLGAWDVRLTPLCS
eukprot:gb/GEZJ01001230.1/.p3 GENE.gb/GEZJ01001230.1/~~gb/GEZJ01001230.1/.p3  ORF type:complete len:264 (-),score=43.01 gb/GEZJ01001230.1/:1869-2624(-)